MRLGTLDGNKPPTLDNPGSDTLKTRPQRRHNTHTMPGLLPDTRTTPGPSRRPPGTVGERNAGPEKDRADINHLEGAVQPDLGQQ